MSDSDWIEPSVPIASAASQSPRRIASTASWIAVAPEAQAVDSEIGAPLLPTRAAIRSATPPNWKVASQSGCRAALPVIAARSTPAAAFSAWSRKRSSHSSRPAARP